MTDFYDEGYNDAYVEFYNVADLDPEDLLKYIAGYEQGCIDKDNDDEDSEYVIAEYD